MRKLKYIVTQRQAYKVTTKRKHSDSVADNRLNQPFNPKQVNLIWLGDVTYLRTNQGWMYFHRHGLIFSLGLGGTISKE
ncbi:integrase catalytic subunit [Psychromonas sp. CNPT3]|nr:integrase catalytic subunit [Psychromonas sp. CNPT3]